MNKKEVENRYAMFIVISLIFGIFLGIVGTVAISEVEMINKGCFEISKADVETNLRLFSNIEIGFNEGTYKCIKITSP